MAGTEKIIILDFGGQYNQLIARRVREAGVYCEILNYATPMDSWRDDALKGVILTGGPNSVYGEDAPRLPGVVALLLPGLTSEEALARLDLMGIQASGGAACASRDQAPSHVYRAMGLSEADARRVLRFSIGRSTTETDLRTAARAISKLYGF